MTKSQLADEAKQIESVCRRLATNRRVRRSLQGGGRIHMDRQLPFLCVYRKPVNRRDPGTSEFVKSEAAYLTVSASKKSQAFVNQLIQGVVQALAPEFGAFLVVEIWSGPDSGGGTDHREPDVLPRFCVMAPSTSAISSTVETLVAQLGKVRILKRPVKVDAFRCERIAPDGCRPLLSDAFNQEHNCIIIGIELPPVWRDLEEDHDFPLLMRSLSRRISHALRRGIFEFVQRRTTHKPPHYLALGRRAVVKAVWAVDEQLAFVSSQFDFLLQVTPINSHRAWRQFRANRFERLPDFHYLPTPVNPAVLKRKLYAIPIERVEDPALHQLFREKQEELDRQITMIRDRNTPAFLLGSRQLFGDVEDDLYRLAQKLLDEIPSRSRSGDGGEKVDARMFLDHAEVEFRHYQAISAGFQATAEITPAVAGIMVSRGKLLINQDLQIPRSRLAALLHHEIGTHLLTYFNGRAQPFRQLYTGLAGYDELQEGLAVLSEYLVNGLSKSRMRQLAARVVATKQLIDGATFIDTFRLLDRDYDFSQRNAFSITMRVYRGGGLTKDAVYLRGLNAILKYLACGGDLDPLFVGKLSADHIPIIKELQLRKVLQPPPWMPRYLGEEAAQQRLATVRSGVRVVELL